MTTRRSIKIIFPVLLVLVAIVGFISTQKTQSVAADSVNSSQSARIAQAGDGDEDEYWMDDEYPDPFQAAADVIGISVDELWDALDNGQTIAELAAANGVELQTVIDAMVATEYEFIDQMLADGEIDAEEAEEWRNEVVEYTTEMVNEAFDDLYFDEDFVDPLDVAAETIGVDIDALWDAVDNGQTIAEVAAEHGVDAQTVIDAMVAAEYTFIDELLAEDEIDAAEAEEWRAEVIEYTTEMVNETLVNETLVNETLVNSGFDDLYFDEDFVDPLDVAAETIGVDIDTFWDALDSGKTVAEIAAEHGVELQTVIDAMMASENAFIDELLADGEIDEAEAEEWRSEMVEYITEAVNETLVNESWEWDEYGVELYFDEACVIEADGASLDQLDVPEGCLDGFAVFGATARP